ncbi:hypothetical protein LINPERHAP1_LOCUS13268 [Linum perenne]
MASRSVKSLISMPCFMSHASIPTLVRESRGRRRRCHNRPLRSEFWKTTFEAKQRKRIRRKLQLIIRLFAGAIPNPPGIIHN